MEESEMSTTSESRSVEVGNSTGSHTGNHPFPQSALLHRKGHTSHSYSKGEEEGDIYTSGPYVGEMVDTPSLDAASIAGGTLECGAYGDMPSQRKPRAEKEVTYYLNTSYACQNGQYSLIAHFPLQAQELLAHLLHQAVKRREGKVFIPCRVMQRDITDCPHKTEDVWGPLHDAGYVEVSSYSFTDGRARTFTLTDTFWTQWDASYSADARPTRQVSGGKRLRKGRRIYATRLSDDSGNSYTGLVSHTMKASKDGMRVTVDMDALQDLMQYREEEIQNLPLGHPALPRLTERLRGDRQRMDTMKAQVPEEEDGLLSYEIAYAVQDGSGRVTEVGGGVQGLTREAKEAALMGQTDIFNYDIASAHHAIAIAYAKAHGIDATALEDFDRKQFMKLTGCIKDEAKTLFYGVMNGAAVPTCPAHALAMRDGKDPLTVEETIEDIHQRTGTSYDTLYEAAQRFLRPVQKTMEEIAHHYITAFYDAHGTAGGRYGKGLRGASGIIFYRDQYEGSKLRKAALCHLLQGTEAAMGHALIAQQDGRGYTVLSHEHDGVVTRGTISHQDISDALHTVSVEAGFCVRSIRLILKPYNEEMPQHFIDHINRRPSRRGRRTRTRKASTPHTRDADLAQDTGDRYRYRTRDGRGHK